MDWTDEEQIVLDYLNDLQAAEESVDLLELQDDVRFGAKKRSAYATVEEWTEDWKKYYAEEPGTSTKLFSDWELARKRQATQKAKDRAASLGTTITNLLSMMPEEIFFDIVGKTVNRSADYMLYEYARVLSSVYVSLSQVDRETRDRLSDLREVLRVFDPRLLRWKYLQEIVEKADAYSVLKEVVMVLSTPMTLSFDLNLYDGSIRPNMFIAIHRDRSPEPLVKYIEDQSVVVDIMQRSLIHCGKPDPSGRVVMTVFKWDDYPWDSNPKIIMAHSWTPNGTPTFLSAMPGPVNLVVPEWRKGALDSMLSSSPIAKPMPNVEALHILGSQPEFVKDALPSARTEFASSYTGLTNIQLDDDLEVLTINFAPSVAGGARAFPNLRRISVNRLPYFVWFVFPNNKPPVREIRAPLEMDHFKSDLKGKVKWLVTPPVLQMYEPDEVAYIARQSVRSDDIQLVDDYFI